MIHRSVLEKAGWKLWSNNISRGLDNDSVERLKRLGVEYEQLPPDSYPRVVDVKSAENIWPFNHLHGSPYPIEEIMNRLSEKEKRQLEKCLEEST